jgi:hypothetical protein
MIKTRALFAAFAVGASAIVAGFIAAPFNGSARAAAGDVATDLVAERIGGAFAVAELAEAAQPVKTAAVRAAKGDLPVSLDCVDQTWPAVKQDCLVTADGTPAPRARFITIDSQSGEAETVLLRLPASLVASR